MPLAEATAITAQASSPGLHGEPHDPAADRQVLEQLAACCEPFSPRVGLDTIDPPAGLLLDITGLARLFGGEPALAAQVVGQIEHRGYHARLGLADTVGAAWAAARFHDRAPRLTNRAWIIPPGASLRALSGLPVAALRLPEETRDLLQQLGIHCLQQLLGLPRDSLAVRLGPLLARRLDQLAGTEVEVFAAHRPPPDFHARCSLEHPTHQRDALLRVLDHLATHLAQLLGAHHRGALQLECRLACTAERQVRIELGLFRPATDARHWLDLLRMQLETLHLPGPVQAVEIRALATAPLVGHQRKLLPDGDSDWSSQLAVLIDRLSSRLGRQAVVAPRLVADALPERSWRYVPWTDQGRAAGSRRPTRQSTTLGPLQRPLRLHCPPLPIRVVAVAPDGPPVVFHHDQQRHQVARHWGPERIETAWWRGRTVRRDYYRVEIASGQRFWLFRQLADGKWFLQGIFD